MPIQLSQRIQSIQPSATAVMASVVYALQQQGKTIYSLNVGEPSFASPECVKARAKWAIDHNKTQYTTVDGIAELRQAIIDRYQRDYRLSFALNEICVTTGAKHSLHNIFNCLFNEGDEVIYFTPYWVSYPDMIRLCGAVPIEVETTIDQNFAIDVKRLRQAMTAKTKAIILNAPNNPSGAIYTKDNLLELASLLEDYPQVVVISDEIYDQIYWDLPLPSFLNVAPQLRDRFVIVNGLSKSYAMAGWRVGYVIAPTHFIDAIKKFQSQSLSCACSISQYASVPALALTHNDLSVYIKAYQSRVDFVCDVMSEIQGMEVMRPKGGFYVFPSIHKILERANIDDQTFCLQLLEQAQVAIMPGSAFGASGYLRLSCASEMRILEQAMRRLKKFIATLNCDGSILQ